MSSEDKPIEYVAATEEDQVFQNLIIFLNTSPDIPVSMLRINYEFMAPSATCMAMSTVQSTYIVERNIIGDYIAECQFKLIYRVKPGISQEARLQADELLNHIAKWAESSAQDLDLGPGITVETLEQTTLSSLFARFEDGWEDHQIFMRLTYKVRPQKVR